MSATPTWWEIASTVGSALATIVVAVFAAFQLARDRLAKLGRERSARIQISAAGYLLRQRLSRWNNYDAASAKALQGWVDKAKRSQTFATEIDGAIGECREMMNLLDDAPADIASRVREVFVFLVEGTRRLSEFAAMPEPNEHDIYEWTDLRDHAYSDFRECLKLLEDGTIVERVLLNEEALLSRLRKSQTLEGRLARILEAEQPQSGDEPIAKDPESLRDVDPPS